MLSVCFTCHLGVSALGGDALGAVLSTGLGRLGIIAARSAH
ncbi:hypothetical protein I545_1446 [Mycobacterium kansasii 662]|nr:hypothetical protein I545_1446 [Mycobacterium kansasii 662]KEP42536.1 hypothetical protein MKSMC1_23380 [Mycobacterium kansasii]